MGYRGQDEKKPFVQFEARDNESLPHSSVISETSLLDIATKRPVCMLVRPSIRLSVSVKLLGAPACQSILPSAIYPLVRPFGHTWCIHESHGIEIQWPNGGNVSVLLGRVSVGANTYFDSSGVSVCLHQPGSHASCRPSCKADLCWSFSFELWLKLWFRTLSDGVYLHLRTMRLASGLAIVRAPWRQVREC